MNSPPEEALNSAALLYKAGQYEKALSVLHSAVIQEENYLEYAYILGLCYAKLKKYDEALLYLEQMVTENAGEERETQCRLVLAYIYIVTGRYRLAEYELKKLLGAASVSAVTYSALGHTVWKQGRIKDGLEWYKRALELDPENPTALNGFGYLLACDNRDLEKALSCCRKALDMDPENPAYLDSFGWACFKLGKLEEAGKHLNAAAKRLGNNEECRNHLEEYRKAMLIK